MSTEKVATPRKRFGKKEEPVAFIEFGEGSYPVRPLLKLSGADLTTHDEIAGELSGANGTAELVRMHDRIVDFVGVLVPTAPRGEISDLPFAELLELVSWVRGGYREEVADAPLTETSGEAVASPGGTE